MSLLEQFSFYLAYANSTNAKSLARIIKAIEEEDTFVHIDHMNNLAPIGAFYKIETLYVFESQISDLKDLKDLYLLKAIYIGTSRISNLDPLKSIYSLETLVIDNSLVSDLSPLKSEHLKNLSALGFDSTPISDLSPLKDLINLKRLSFNSTQIKDLNPLKNLVNLEHLSISSTEVSDLSPLKNLTKLKSLVVSSTKVIDLTPLENLIKKGLQVTWGSFKGENGIYIENTSLINPPIEIAQQGNKAILRYWGEKNRVGIMTLNEARLLIVGQGGAGKTTLSKKLIDYQADLPTHDETTRGIDIETLTFKNDEGFNFNLHIWDFGGQNIQHYAHQFFLSDSVVYALVHSGREQNNHSSYWLSVIELLGKNSPVLLIQNEKHGHSEDLKDLDSIRQRFPNVTNAIKLDLSKVSHEAKDIFENLQEEIKNLACHLPHVGKEYLRSFSDVREKLDLLSLEKPSITWEDFENICDQQGISDPELIKDYAQYFHQLGISLWFEEDYFLRNYIFLRPKWIIDALFELLYDGEVLRKKWRIKEQDAETIWRGKEYKGMHGNLLRLMKNFDMCYDIAGDTPQYIIPQLLPYNHNEQKVTDDATRVVFQYKFLPKGFISRLTCRLHNRIKGDNVWNDSVQFIDNNAATVFAKEIYASNAIELIAEGDGKRHILNEVINTLKDINASTKFANLQVEILVPCPCKICQKAERPHQFDYDYLKRKVTKGQIKAECKLSLDDILISNILREVNAFSFKEIKEKVGNGQLKEVLNLMSGRFPDNSEVIQLKAQVSRLNSKEIGGVLSNPENALEYNQITDRLLKLITILEEIPK